MKISKELLIKLEELYSQYEKKILKAEEDKCLKANTSKTYLLHSNNFMRWIKDEFQPSERNNFSDFI